MRSLLLAVLLALPGLSHAQRAPNPVEEFCGLNTQVDASKIKDCETPDAQNVLTDNGGLEKRPGNTRIATILAGYSVAMAKEFIAPSGTRYLIAHASKTVYQTDLGSTPTALSTTALNANLDMIAAYGKAIFQDGSGNPWYWDGTSTATLSGMPICKYMAFADERVYCANIPSESSSRVRVSSFGATSYFTVPANVAQIPDAPNVFDFQKDDGEAITCFESTPWGKVVGKRHSMHILKGYDNSTFYKRPIDPKIGCIDDRSMQMVDGLLIWLSFDGIYAWNGSGPPLLLSRDIDNLVRQIRQINSAAAEWVVDVLGDWNQGVSSMNGLKPAWSTTLVAGSIVPSSNTWIDNSTTTFGAGSFAGSTVSAVSASISSMSAAAWAHNTGFEYTNAALGHNFDFWTRSGSEWFTQAAAGAGYCGQAAPGTFLWPGNFSATNFSTRGNMLGIGDDIVVTIQNGSGDVLYSSSHTLSALAPCDHYSIDLSTQTGDMRAYLELKIAPGPPVQHISMFSPVFRSTSLPSGRFDYGVGGSNNEGFSNPGRVAIDFPDPWFQRTSTFTSRAFDTQFATPTFNAPGITVSSTSAETMTFYEQSSSDCSSWDARIAWTPGNKPVGKKRCWRYQLELALTRSTATAALHSLGNIVAIGTGTYYSDVHFIGSNISEFLAFNATLNDGGGLTFQTRTDAATFDEQAASPAWVAQTNNTTIDSTPAAYYQFRIDSTNVVIATEAAQVLRVGSNWQEGSGKPVASGVQDHRYFLCAQLSSTTAQNDGCLVYQKNNRWTKWTGPGVYSMGQFNNGLIVGSTETASYVWKIMQDGVYQDDGAPILAYWKSKQFTLERPYQQKILHEIWVDGVRQSTGSLGVAFAVEKSTSFTTRSVTMNDQAGVFNRRIALTAGYVLGKYLQFSFANYLVDEFFKINGYMFLTELKDRQAE